MAVYRIDEFLGEGGFAYVYKARDTNLEIDVALKVLKPAFAYDEVFEAKVAASPVWGPSCRPVRPSRPSFSANSRILGQLQ